MDKATRIKVAEELNKHFTGGISFTEEKVRRFQKVNPIGSGGSRYNYEVYAAQMGDLTIMVWISGDGAIHVNAQAW